MQCLNCRLRSLGLSNLSPTISLRSIQPWRPLNTRPFRLRQQQRRYQHSQEPSRNNPADSDPNWVSLAERDPVYMRSRRKHGPGLIILALIPLTAFAMGTWQVQRLRWKTDLIARLEDQLVRPPLPLPPHINPDAVPEFDHRRVVAVGVLRHDEEMLIGPRIRDGKEGYIVVTPLERTDGASKILISRGWIEKAKGPQRMRGVGALPRGVVQIEGLLREPPKKNSFTPDNRPDKGEFYFPDVKQMAELTGAEPIWVEATMEPELFEILNRTANGIPIGRPPTVQLHNSHAQYIVTWYGLGIATSIMFWLLVKRKPANMGGRIRRSEEW